MNTMSLLSQLSKCYDFHVDSAPKHPLRQFLMQDEETDDFGIEVTSNIFYYLFDDWRTIFGSVVGVRQSLKDLVSGNLVEYGIYFNDLQ